MRIVLLSACLAALASGAVPCSSADGRNGSTLCVALGIKGGQLTVAEFAFAPTGSYKADSGKTFFALAQAEIAKLAKPCAVLLAQGAKPAPPFCSQDSSWAEFTTAYLALADSLERVNFLSEAGVFRPLITAHQHTPLLFFDVNAEAGIVTFRIPDRLDPRTNGTFQVEVRGAPDNATRDRRTVQLRQALNPLRNQVFCHDRIRARVQAFYKKLRIPIDIIQLDPQGPLLIIQEKP